MSRRRPVAALALALALAVAAAPAVAQGPPAAAKAQERLPAVNHSGLEPAVAGQLDALRALVDATAADPDVDRGFLAEAVGELGRHYLAYGLLDAAEPCFVEARRLAPGDFRWIYHLGYLHQLAGRLDEAAAAYEAALAIVSGVPPALVRLGKVYADRGQLEEAERTLRAAVEANSTSAAARAVLGEVLVARGQHREAVELLESALELEPDANRLNYPLGLAYRGLGDEDEARRRLAASGPIGVAPADPLIDGLAKLVTGERVHLLRGRAAFGAGRYGEAIEAFRQAVEADPSSISARVNLGSALGQAGDIEGAVQEYRRVLVLAPANPTALFNLGALLRRTGDLEGALELLREAERYEPRDTGIALELGDALRQAGRSEEALGRFRRVVEIDPASEPARLAEVRELLVQGRFAEARERLEEGGKALPASASLASALARLLAGSPDLSLRDGARATELALAVYRARMSPYDAETLALALAEQGRCEEAASWQQQVVDEVRDTVPAERLGELEAALESYRRTGDCRPLVPAGS